MSEAGSRGAIHTVIGTTYLTTVKPPRPSLPGKLSYLWRFLPIPRGLYIRPVLAVKTVYLNLWSSTLTKPTGKYETRIDSEKCIMYNEGFSGSNNNNTSNTNTTLVEMFCWHLNSHVMLNKRKLSSVLTAACLATELRKRLSNVWTIN